MIQILRAAGLGLAIGVPAGSLTGLLAGIVIGRKIVNGRSGR